MSATSRQRLDALLAEAERSGLSPHDMWRQELSRLDYDEPVDPGNLGGFGDEGEPVAPAGEDDPTEFQLSGEDLPEVEPGTSFYPLPGGGQSPQGPSLSKLDYPEYARDAFSETEPTRNDPLPLPRKKKWFEGTETMLGPRSPDDEFRGAHAEEIEEELSANGSAGLGGRGEGFEQQNQGVTKRAPGEGPKANGGTAQPRELGDYQFSEGWNGYKDSEGFENQIHTGLTNPGRDVSDDEIGSTLDFGSEDMDEAGFPTWKALAPGAQPPSQSSMDALERLRQQSAERRATRSTERPISPESQLAASMMFGPASAQSQQAHAPEAGMLAPGAQPASPAFKAIMKPSRQPKPASSPRRDAQGRPIAAETFGENIDEADLYGPGELDRLRSAVAHPPDLAAKFKNWNFREPVSEEEALRWWEEEGSKLVSPVPRLREVFEASGEKEIITWAPGTHGANVQLILRELDRSDPDGNAVWNKLVHAGQFAQVELNRAEAAALGFACLELSRRNLRSTNEVELALDVVEQIEKKFGQLDQVEEVHDKLAKSSAKEKGEHPWLSDREAARVAKDHESKS